MAGAVARTPPVTSGRRVSWVVSTYREHPRDSPVVQCLWEQQAPGGHTQLIVPDGCVDLVWSAGRGLVVAGPDTGPREVVLPAGTSVAAIRLRPGAAGAALGVSAAAVLDREVPAGDVLGDDRLLASLDGGDPLEVLSRWVDRRRVEPDPLVRVSARLLARPGARVAQVAADLGVGERQLHRRTVAAVGYGPKMLARVLRLRRLTTSGGDLAVRALEAGYASQSHMTDEVRRLTGRTPVRFLEDRFPVRS